MGNNAFQYCHSFELQADIIPPTITQIGDYAFYVSLQILEILAGTRIN